jgi:putative addiction module killer protein
VEPTSRTLLNYLTEDGCEPFEEWIKGLRDGKGRGIVRDRLNRIRIGNFGDCRPVGGGVHELRIDFGPGYRVYFGEDGESVILLCGGDKSTQQSDIPRAQRLWNDYNA